MYVSVSTSGKLYLKDNSFPTLLGHLRVKMWKYAALVSWIFQDMEKKEFKPWEASNAIRNIDASSPGAALHRGFLGLQNRCN